MINQSRLEVANQVLEYFEGGYEFHLGINRNKALTLSWAVNEKLTTRMWMTQRGSFYPTWSDICPTGGTHITAIAQLVNWIRDRPCLPIQSWRYWTSSTVGMKNGGRILPLLENSDYPKENRCYFCGSKSSRLDWYYFNKKHSGLGCLPECQEIKNIQNKIYGQRPFVQVKV